MTRMERFVLAVMLVSGAYMLYLIGLTVRDARQAWRDWRDDR